MVVTRRRIGLVAMLLLTLLSGCAPKPAAPPPALIGAWRSKVQFDSGALAAVKDLEFMFVFNAGGTLTESSNYDGMPPVPPAYGEWRQTGPDTYEAKYLFFTTRPPADVKALATGGGWSPSGHGQLIEKFRLAADHNSYTSDIELLLFDQSNDPVAGGGHGTSQGVRLKTEPAKE